MRQRGRHLNKGKSERNSRKFAWEKVTVAIQKIEVKNYHEQSKNDFTTLRAT